MLIDVYVPQVFHGTKNKDRLTSASVLGGKGDGRDVVLLHVVRRRSFCQKKSQRAGANGFIGLQKMTALSQGAYGNA